MTPRRIRWQRFEGRLPEGARSVMRPSRWGNPFRVDEHGRAKAVELFRAYAVERLAREPDWLEPLRGLDLACSCEAGLPCHGDVLIDLANRPEDPLTHRRPS